MTHFIWGEGFGRDGSLPPLPGPVGPVGPRGRLDIRANERFSSREAGREDRALDL